LPLIIPLHPGTGQYRPEGAHSGHLCR
jgi:hypothetical protein